MLKGVETVTGGASAAYGTDAVSGVVNFLLNTDFEGFEGHAETGHTFRGDGDNSEFSLAFGTKVGSRAHLLLWNGDPSRAQAAPLWRRVRAAGES